MTAPLAATDGLVTFATVDVADGMAVELVAASTLVVVASDTVHKVQVLEAKAVDLRVVEVALFSADTMTCFKSTLNSCLQNLISSALI